MAEQSNFIEPRMIPLPPSLWPTVYGYAGRCDWPPTTAVYGRLLADRATREDLLPLLADDPAVPAVVKEELRSYSGLVRLYEQRTRLVFEELGRVADVLRGEPFMVLKGADYASRLYPQRRHRPFRDIDILVPSARMSAAADRLIDAGFIEFIFGLDGEVASHHERTFRRSGISIDLHQWFVQRARHAIDYEAIWDRRVAASIDGAGCFRLADEDAIFYQALSIAIKELHVPIIRYLDLQRLIAYTPGALLKAATNASRWQAINALVAALSQARRVFPELDAHRIDEALVEIAPTQRRKRIERLLPDPAMAGSMQRALPRLQQLRRKWMLLDGPSRRIKFAVAYVRATLSGLLVRLKRRS